MTFLEQRYQHIKNTVHGLQGLGVLVAWIITIAVFTRAGRSGGQTRYFFALCWITIPILIYQTAVPTFNRTKRFSNAYAHAVLDVLFTILWLAAFAAVAAWTNQGINNVKDRKDGEKGCDRFAYGSTGKCKLSQGSIGCGVIICLLFAATSALAIYALLHYRRHGSLPGASSTSAVPITDNAFSSNPHDDDYEADELHNADDHSAYDPPLVGRGRRDDDEYQSIHTDTEEGGAHPGRPLSWGQQPHGDTSYHGASGAQGGYDYPSHSQQQAQKQQQNPFRNPSPYRQPSPLSTHEYGGGGGGQAPQLPPLGGVGGGGDPFRDDLALSHDHGGYGGSGNSGGRVDIPDASDYRPGSRLA